MEDYIPNVLLYIHQFILNPSVFGVQQHLNTSRDCILSCTSNDPPKRAFFCLSAHCFVVGVIHNFSAISFPDAIGSYF